MQGSTECTHKSVKDGCLAMCWSWSINRFRSGSGARQRSRSGEQSKKTLVDGITLAPCAPVSDIMCICGKIHTMLVTLQATIALASRPDAGTCVDFWKYMAETRPPSPSTTEMKGAPSHAGYATHNNDEAL